MAIDRMEKRSGNERRGAQGFTLVELLVVLAIISLLISIVAPHYMGRMNRAEEAVLKEDLLLMRDALDKHYADAGVYPNSLDELVSKRYLRSIPSDPMTKSAQTWVVVPPADSKKGKVFDVKSGATGKGADGKPYAQW
jgi:general secretion pathway protein G